MTPTAAPHSSSHDQTLPPRLNPFLSALSSRQVMGDPIVCDRYRSATYAKTASPLGILFPETVSEVQACVRIAAEHSIPLYPISRGCNWGYGSRAPIQSGGVVLDLSRMNSISHYDATLGTVRLEPGVSQGELYHFLKAAGGHHWMDATAAGPNASIVGNVLERGFGHTPLAERSVQVCDLEAVLGDGSVVRTGFGDFANSTSASVYRFGVGPSIDQLFFQSNFGIVVGLTLWLLPAPEAFETFVLRIHDDAGLLDAIERLRPLRQAGILQSAIHIANVYRYLSSELVPSIRTEYLPLSEVRTVANRLGLPLWLGFGGLYGPRSVVRGLRTALYQAFKGSSVRVEVLCDPMAHWIAKLAPLFRPFFRNTQFKLSGLSTVFDLLKGVPTDRPLRGIYLKKPASTSISLNPDQDRCGLYWISPVLPHHFIHVARVQAIAAEVLSKEQFEAGMTFTLLNGRAIDSVLSIIYDRDLPDADEHASRCHTELFERLVEEGYYPYRLGTHQYRSLSRRAPRSTQLQRELKMIFDPKGIIAPGRHSIPFKEPYAH